LGASAVLVSPHDGRVEHHVLIVVISGQHVEDTFKNTALRPAIEALPDRLPATEPLGQIPPGTATAVTVEHSLDKEPIVLGRAADVTFTPRQKVLDPVPLIISKGVTTHRPALLKADLSWARNSRSWESPKWRQTLVPFLILWLDGGSFSAGVTAAYGIVFGWRPSAIRSWCVP
jgi:hypothetical protein